MGANITDRIYTEESCFETKFVSSKEETRSDFELWVNKIAVAVINTLSYLSSCVTRYIGSKSFSIWGVSYRLCSHIAHKIFDSSYNKSLDKALFFDHYQFLHTPATKKKAKSFIEASSCCTFVQSSDKKWVEKLELNVIDPKSLDLQMDGIKCCDGYILDVESGLKIALCEKNGKVYISYSAKRAAYPGAESLNESKDYIAVENSAIVSNLVGGKPARYLRGIVITKALLNSSFMQGKQVHLTGQCFGGSVAQAAALTFGVKATLFNTFAMGAGIQQLVGDKNILKAKKLITHVSAKSDYVSQPWYIKPFDYTLGFLGIRTAGNFGKKFSIPTAYTDTAETHKYFLGSLFEYLGYDKRDLPSKEMLK